MKRMLVFFSLILLCMSAMASEELRPLPRVTLVHMDEASNDALYLALETVPMNVFHTNGKVYQSPVICDVLDNEINGFLLDDYVAYLASQGGVQTLEVVGDVPIETQNAVLSQLGLTSAQMSHIYGNAIEAGARITQHDWINSEYVVLAPYKTDATEEDIESAAAAAAIAADLNAPLLYTYTTGIPWQTKDEFTRMGATKTIIVDYTGIVEQGVLDQLATMNVTVTNNLKDTASVIAYMKGRAGNVTLCQCDGLWQLLPAAYAGAVYRGSVFFYEAAAAANDSVDVAQMMKSMVWSAEKTNTPVPDDVRAGESTTWSNFQNWMVSVGADDPNNLETVLTFAGQNYPSYVLERAITGDPRDPANPGCFAGRFPLTYADGNLAAIVRTTMYRAIVFGNPRRNRANFCGVCYVAGNTGPGNRRFTNSEGVSHLVNEFYGGAYWGDAGEPGVFQNLSDDGAEMMLHNGYDPGSGTDPMFGYDLTGFIAEMNTGSNFFYYTGHGNTNSISAFTIDQAIRQDCTYGSTYWPLQSGMITSGGNNFSTNQLLATFTNIHSAAGLYDACLVSAPNSTWNEAWLRKGGAFSMGSYVSVGWENSGYFCSHFIEGITTSDKTVGESFGVANALASAVYPSGQGSPSPDNLRYIIVGDPNMMYNQPAWSSPAPSALNTNYNGHKPANTTGVDFSYLNAAGNTDRITVAWNVGDETDTVGYNVYRHVIGEKTWNKLNNNIIPSGARKYRYEDSSALKGLKYEYIVTDISAAGVVSSHGPVVGRILESKLAFSLSNAAPNPFTSMSTIRYSLTNDAQTRLAIYDMSGRLVKVLVDGPNTSGEHQINWDGTDSANNRVSAGVYVYTLSSGNNNTSKRLVVAR